MSDTSNHGREEVARANQDAAAVQLRSEGATYRQIAAQLQIGIQTAYEAVQRGLDTIRRQPAEELVTAELEHLDHLREQAARVLHARHLVTSGTDLVKSEDGQVLVDHGPVLGAIRALLAVAERRAKLLGLDAPSRVDTRVSLEAAWAAASERERDAVITADIAAMKAELDRRAGPAAFDRMAQEFAQAQQYADDQAEEMAAAVTAALDALGIPEEQREASYAAVEVMLRTRGPQGNGGPS